MSGSAKKKQKSPFDLVPELADDQAAVRAAALELMQEDEAKAGCTDEQVRQAQRALQVVLPEGYVHSMRAQNGGDVKGVPWVTGNVELASIAGVDELQQQYELSHEEWGVPQWLIPLGGDGHGWVCFDYREEEARSSGNNVPIVSCYQDDDPEYNPVPFAADWSDFLVKMAELKEPE